MRVMSSKIAIFTARGYALHGLSHRNSVRPSVRLSVCVHCVPMVRPTIMVSSPYESMTLKGNNSLPIILGFGDIRFIPKFEGGHPERGR